MAEEQGMNHAGKHRGKSRFHGKHPKNNGSKAQGQPYSPPYDASILSKPIESLGLSEATLSALLAGKIHSVRDLALRRMADMYRIQNFGKRNLNEVLGALDRIGVALRPTEPKPEAQSTGKDAKPNARAQDSKRTEDKPAQEVRKDGKNHAKNPERRDGRPDGKKPFAAQRDGRPEQDKNKNGKNRPADDMTLEKAFPRPKFVPSKPDPMPHDIFAKYQRGGKWGFKDAAGKEVIPAIYDEAFSFKDDMACVERNQLFGYINRENELIIPYQYECASSFSEGFACVGNADKCGYINKQGEKVTGFIYDAGTAVTGGLAKVKKDGKWGTLTIATGEISWA